MYQTDFVCTYKQHEEELQEDMYRAQFLQAFDLKTWDEDKINVEIKRLYDVCRKTDNFQELLDKLKNSEELKFMLSIMGNDDEILFRFLFKYELYDNAHKYFCSVLQKKPFDSEAFRELLQSIK